MSIYARLVLFVSVLLPVSALADAEYNRKENIVYLRSEGSDAGWVKIHNEKHIVVGGIGFDSTTQKSIFLCGKDPSLGLLILDGKLQLGSGKLPPNVTGVIQLLPPKVTGYPFGIVHSYVLKGDDAQDLMDMLLEYRQVGFAILSECPDTEDSTSGKIILNFDTRGIERALKRIK